MIYYLNNYSLFITIHINYQDMLDPEIYLAEYEIRNLASGTSSIQCGRYRIYNVFFYDFSYN